MEELNKKCSYVNSTYITKNYHLYSYELLEQMEKQSKVYKKEIDDVLDENKVIESLYNPKECYDILLYLIIFENDLTKKYISDIALNVLEYRADEYFNPILYILMMKTKLNDEIVKKIIDITDEKYVKNHSRELGTEPFDYRYHILKRKEISVELKNEILARYSFDYDYNEDNEREIYNDINFELEKKQLSSMEEIENDESLSDEIRAYQLIRKRKFQN